MDVNTSREKKTTSTSNKTKPHNLKSAPPRKKNIEDVLASPLLKKDRTRASNFENDHQYMKGILIESDEAGHHENNPR